MNKKELRAKELFLKYNCSHFHMDREGEYTYYRSYGITKDQEKAWAIEYQHELLNVIKDEDIESLSFSSLIRVICEYTDLDCLTELLKIVKIKKNHVDTFTQLRMAESLLQIIESDLKGREINKLLNIPRSPSIVDTIKGIKIYEETKELALDILHSALEKPITVDQYYHDLGYLKDVLTETEIKSRIRMNLNEYYNASY